MKCLLTILALLPLVAMAQRPISNSSRNEAGFPETKIQYLNGRKGPVPYYTDRLNGTIYIIDDVKVATVEPVVIEKVELRLDMNNPTTLVLQRKDIATLPCTDLTDMVSLSTSIHQLQRGAANHISAGRPEEILYVIDGMQIARR